MSTEHEISRDMSEALHATYGERLEVNTRALETRVPCTASATLRGYDLQYERLPGCFESLFTGDYYECMAFLQGVEAALDAKRGMK